MKWVVKGFRAGAEVYYATHDGEDLLAEDITHATAYPDEETALHVAEELNKTTILHGVYFDAKEID